MAYPQCSRLDLRDEILRLPAEASAAVHAAIPKRVFDTYLLPPLGEVAERVQKRLFPERDSNPR